MQINYRESNRASLLTVHRTVVVQLIGPLVPGRALALHVVLVDARDECPASAVRLHVAESLEVGNKIRLLQAQKVHWVSFDTKSLLPHTHTWNVEEYWLSLSLYIPVVVIPLFLRSRHDAGFIFFEFWAATDDRER